MTALAHLQSYELSIPDTWASIPVTTAEPGWAQEAAVQLCDGEQERADLAAALERSHPDMVANQPDALWVWVPDRTVPNWSGMMTMTWLTPDNTWRLDRATYRELIEPDHRSGVSAMERVIADVDLPAGDALLVREIVERSESTMLPWRKALQENVIYALFPAGSFDALQFMFSTMALHLGDVLADDAAAVLKSVRVTLDEVPE
ncbi:MAG: hypothetical protein GEU83_14290 [Pseudonocardiaceae bacterium]|nr:hypothetical protein [Pseudonocardiaceae bacterium]